MSGLRTQIGPGGRRLGDVVLQVPDRVPRNLVTKAILASLRISRRRAPQDLKEIGFARVEFELNQGATRVTLYVASKGAPNERSNSRTSNIASGTLRYEGLEITVFDEGRGRIKATRTVSPSSLDDPDSLAAIALQIGTAGLKLSVKAAGNPAIAGKIISAIPLLTQKAREMHGTATNEQIRVARHETELKAKSTCLIRTGRTDRILDPMPKTSGATHAQRQSYVLGVLLQIGRDLQEVLANVHGGDANLVLLEWVSLCEQSLSAWRENKMWPLALRMLAFDDGPAQFVRRVSDGRIPCYE